MTKKRFKVGLAILGVLGMFLMALLALVFAPTLASADKGTGIGYYQDGDSQSGHHNPGYVWHPGNDDAGNGGNRTGHNQTPGDSGPCSLGPCEANNNGTPAGGGSIPDDHGQNGGAGQGNSQGGQGNGEGGQGNGQGGQGYGFGPFGGGGFWPGSGGGGAGGNSSNSCTSSTDKSQNTGNDCDKDSADNNGVGSDNHSNGDHDGQGSDNQGSDDHGSQGPDNHNGDHDGKDSGDNGLHDSGGDGPFHIASNDPTDHSDGSVDLPGINDDPPPGPNDFLFNDLPIGGGTDNGDKPSGDGPVTILTGEAPTEVPEPFTLSLFAVGLGGAAMLRRRKNPAA